MKPPFHRNLLVATFLAVAVLSWAQQPAGVRVYSCGNSFHGFVPGMLKEIAVAAGIAGHEIVGTLMIGAAKVLKHWNFKDGENQARSAKTKMAPEDQKARNLPFQQLARETVTHHPLSGVSSKQGTGTFFSSRHFL